VLSAYQVGIVVNIMYAEIGQIIMPKRLIVYFPSSLSIKTAKNKKTGPIMKTPKGANQETLCP